MKSTLKNDHGVVLVSVIMMVVVLLSLSSAGLLFTSLDLKTTAHQKSGTQAFFLAEAGVEWAKRTFQNTPGTPPAPVGATQSLSPGSFVVAFSNITTISDWEYRAAVSSTGTAYTSRKDIQAVIQKTYEIADAPVDCKGNECHSTFTGNAFDVDGRDYDHTTGQLTTAAPHWAVSVPSQTLYDQVDTPLTSEQKDNLIGLGGTSTTPSMGISSNYPSNKITDLANSLCSQATTVNVATDAPTGKGPNGSKSVKAYSGNNTFGTNNSPQVTCISGNTSTPGMNLVDIQGQWSGTGILVVRDADVNIHGDFAFNGLVIITGQQVSLSMNGAGSKDVYGSIMINETSTDTGNELDLQGNASVRYSTSALLKARNLIPPDQKYPLISSSSSSIRQISWKEVLN